MKSVVIGNTGERSYVAAAELDKPGLRGPQDVLIKAICIGLDGTDREIITKNFGRLPAGQTQMVIGHELLGVVELAGEQSGLNQGDLVTALVRRPCNDEACINCRNQRQDFCETGNYLERGISGADGFLCEYVIEDASYVVKVPYECLEYGVLVEPQSIVEKVWNQALKIQQRMLWQPKTALVLGSGPLGILAAMTCRVLGLDTHVWSKSDECSPNAEIIRGIGAHYRQAGSEDESVLPGKDGFFTGLTDYADRLNKRFDMIWECSGHAPLGYEAIPLLHNNGILALLGVTPEHGRLDIPRDLLYQEMVLKNKCVIGSVNASRHDFTSAIDRLREIEKRYPGKLVSLFSKRVSLEEVPEIDFSRIQIKAVVDLVHPDEWNSGFRL